MTDSRTLKYCRVPGVQQLPDPGDVSPIPFPIHSGTVSGIYMKHTGQMEIDMICGAHLGSPKHAEARRFCFIALCLVPRVDHNFLNIDYFSRKRCLYLRIRETIINWTKGPKNNFRFLRS
jgi:hypothetical protein